jgi:hypothetical protein
VRTRILDFSAKHQNIAAGERAARDASEALTRLLRDAADRKTRGIGPEAAPRKAARRAPST